MPTAIPTGGLLRRSCIIASSSGPGSWKISPASRLGDIAASLPAFENVASSKWLTEEPSSYFLGVYSSGFTPPFAATPSGPDQTNFEVSASPSSREGEGRSESLRPSPVCAYASYGVG